MRFLTFHWAPVYMILLSYCFNLISATEPTKQQLKNRKRTVHIGIILFPGFEPLDVIGPLEFIFSASGSYPIEVYTIWTHTGPVSPTPPQFPQMKGISFMASHTFNNVPPLDIILKPGGLGDFALIDANNTVVEDFIKSRYHQVDYLLSVCTGSVSLARAGLLKKKRATTNKALWNLVTTVGPNAKWVPSARWTQDGKIWTSSGVAAGMDMIYAFLVMFYGDEVINSVFNGLEYAPHQDPTWDPFSIVHNARALQPLKAS